jgi:hypothetical protein
MLVGGLVGSLYAIKIYWNKIKHKLSKNENDTP